MIGQRYSVSFNEYKLVNYLYCNKTCELTEQKPECWFGGYQNPNKCNECLCPYPLYGYRCQSLTSDNKGYCPYTSVSPAPYETLLKYYGYRHCSTIIQAPEKHQRIQIIVEHVWLSDNEFCARGDSMLEIKYKEDKSLMGLCFCNHVKDYKIISESNIVIITYHGYRFSQSADVTYKLV
uniref:Peptidase M12A domain-containing protein n=1 Tax=Parastrongyloides trichosuri TaxID=131310 RepID=A0A0N5A6Y7_PARTI